MIFLVLGPALNLLAGFFWQDDTQGATAGALSGVGITLWLIGLLDLYQRLRPRAPRFVGWAVPLTVLGTAGGVAFSVQAIHEEMFGVAHAVAVERLNQFPLAANTLFWICGPLFPAALIALGALLLRLRAVPPVVGVLIVLGGVAFPLSRISREAWIAHVADLLLLIPFVLLPLIIRRRRAGEGVSVATVRSGPAKEQ